MPEMSQAAVGRLDQVKRYFRDVRAEMRKVVWPNRKELVTYTIVVIVATGALSLFIGFVDLVVARTLSLIGGFGG